MNAQNISFKLLGRAKVQLADEFIGMAVCDVESACLDYVLRGTCNCKITQIFKFVETLGTT